MKNIHYINHTHWDREWCRSSDTYRIRSVYVFNMLLDILEKNDDYKCFTFDGQTAALEDYLQLKPENREIIEKYIKEKRILVGPWYTQPDMFLVSGESLLRNLIIGSKFAESMGHCMEVGWIPDAFGQIQSTPQIFKELGMKAVFAWRGFNYEYTKDSIFLWEAPNKDKLLTVHFPLGYGYYRYLPEDENKAYTDIIDTAKKVEGRFKDNELLLMGGSDHTKPQESITNTIKNIEGKLNENGYSIKLSNPEIFVDDVLNSIENSKRELEVFRGEAKSAALGRIHAGITSTRIDIKNESKKYESLLPLVIEPMCLISSTIGGKYEQSIINYYWKTIFKNQFHDSAYSSSPESINQSVKNRLLNLRHGLSELIWMNIRMLKDKLDFSKLKENEEVVVLFNTLPYDREDLAFVNFIIKDKDFVLKDENDNIIPYVIVNSQEEINTEIEYYNGCQNYHDAAEVTEGTKFKIQVKLKASTVPKMGYKVIKICYGEQQDNDQLGNVKLISNRVFENNNIKVEINNNGTLNVTNKSNGLTYKEVHWFDESGDDGDEYNYSPPKDDILISTKYLTPKIELIENNSLEVKFRITYDITTPLQCIDHYRSKETVTSKIITEVSLKDNSKTIDFRTTIKNKAKDHIIKAVFKDIESSNENFSQDHFGTIVRSNTILKQVGLENGGTEEELPIYSMQRFVKLNDTKDTFAVLSKGPCEYIINNNNEIALTILRSVGKFGKADLVIRPGRSSGYRLDAPSSQLLEDVTSEYSLYIEEGIANIGNLYREANILNTPVQAKHLNIFTREKHESKAWETSLLELDKDIELIAFKKSEDDNGYVLRVLNPTKKSFKDKKITINLNIKNAYLSSLKEEKKEKIKIKDNQIILPEIKEESFITLYLE